MNAGKCVNKCGHKGHLCVLASEGCTKEIEDLVRRPKYICFNCGRSARSRKNLCNPMPLKDQ